MHISTVRHDEVFDARKNNTQITIVGAGATGSRVFMALIELGLTNITVFDDDVVEGHNLANQAYVRHQVGKPKVMSLADLYRFKTGYMPPESMLFINERVPCQGIPLKGTVFLLTDTMASRKEIYDKEIKDNPEVTHVIETRMASTHGNIFSFSPYEKAKSQRWRDGLTNDEGGEVSACGSSLSVGTTASIIANMAVWQMMHSMTNPEAVEGRLDVYLNPTMLDTGSI